MLGFLLEVLVSLSICSLLGYFLFLSAPLEEDLGSTESRPPTYRAERHGLGAWLHTIQVLLEDHTAVARAYQALVTLIFGDGVFASEGTVSTSTGRSRPARRRADGTANARNTTPGNDVRREEGSHWLTVLSRWLGIVFIGGGSHSTEVWLDHLQYGAEWTLGVVSAAWDKKVAASTGAVNRNRLGNAPRALVRLLGLDLGPGLTREPVVCKAPCNATLLDATLSNVGSLDGAAREGDLEPLAAVGYAPTPPIVGVAMPRVAGDITSVEVIDFVVSNSSSLNSTRGRTDTVADGAGGTPNQPMSSLVAGRVVLSAGSLSVGEPLGPVGGGGGSACALAHRSANPSSTVVRRSLRCFTVPLYYEDSRFHVRLGCSLPLAALLPTIGSVSIPPDVLALDCQVSIKRVMFVGSLYASFHGAVAELSFARAPQFSAVVDVTPPGTGGEAGGRGSATPGAGVPSRFRATSTMRNVSTTSPGPPPSLLPPHPPTPLGGCLTPRNEKVQEMVLLAIQRAVHSVTYPSVLVLRMKGSCRVEEDGGWLSWSRGTATLPLYS